MSRAEESLCCATAFRGLLFGQFIEEVKCVVTLL